MKLLDFMYFITYKAYERGNKSSFGSFFTNSLWISLFCFSLLMILFIPIEIALKRELFWTQDLISFLIILLSIILFNNIYLNTGKRKEKIATRFNFSKKEEKLFWYLIIVLFFISYGIFAYLAQMRLKLFE